MPIANVINQATASAESFVPTHTQVPQRPLGVPRKAGTPALIPDPVINWGQTRQTQGRDVSVRDD